MPRPVVPERLVAQSARSSRRLIEVEKREARNRAAIERLRNGSGDESHSVVIAPANARPGTIRNAQIVSQGDGQDQRRIVEALQVLRDGPGGGHILIAEGDLTFGAKADLDLDDVTISGLGNATTVKWAASSDPAFSVSAADNTLESFTIDATGSSGTADGIEARPTGVGDLVLSRLRIANAARRAIGAPDGFPFTLGRLHVLDCILTGYGSTGIFASERVELDASGGRLSASNSTAVGIESEGSSDRIYGLEVSGGARGIRLGAAFGAFCEVVGVLIEGFDVTGLTMSGGSDTLVSGVVINATGAGGTGHGIEAGNSQTVLTGVYIEGSDDILDGINIAGEDVEVASAFIWECARDCIHVSSGSGATIGPVVLREAGRYGLHVGSSATNVQISGAKVKLPADHAFYIAGDYTHLTDAYAESVPATKFCIYIETTAADTTALDNNMRRRGSGGTISDNGSGTVLLDQGNTTEGDNVI